MRSFVDTNVLAYADDAGAPKKQAISHALIAELFRARSGVISPQVLREYFVAATRKLRVPVEVAQEQVRLFARFEVALETPEDILAAIDLHRLRGYSLWDCLILRAAIKSGCRRLYSEDLQHGQYIDGVEIVNPFLDIATTA